MKTLIIIRGLPGSGKSTYAKTHYPDADNFEADMFFIGDDGKYKFDATKLKDAHAWCFNNAINSLKSESDSDVIVSNTFVSLWEMENYVKNASKIPGVSVKVVELHSNYGSIHGVPETKMEQMRQRWETIPDSWDVAVERVL